MTLRDAERFGGFSPADESLAEQAGAYGLSSYSCVLAQSHFAQPARLFHRDSINSHIETITTNRVWYATSRENRDAIDRL
jgi:hypothetical protein